YGYVDASGAVDLAESLKGRPAAEIASTLAAKQAARDQGVLDGLAHPARTYAYTERSPLLIGKLTHKIQVDPNTQRIKVVSNGGSLPFVGVTTYDITVKDAKGAKRFADLAFGTWTVEIGAAGTVVPPQDMGPADDAVEKRFVTSLISVFGAQPRACSPVTGFVPVGTQQYRFQDDKASTVAAFPTDPEFNYVGPLPDGTLGNRAPERRLAATFGQLTTTAGREPKFVTAPLAAPLTIGGIGELVAYIQGP